VYASPLGRAQETAGYVALDGFVTVDELMELSMGDWEGLTSDEIAETWGDKMERIYRHGVDLRRGDVGESWGELTARFRNAVHGLEPSAGEVTVAVAHGGAIRAYVASLTAIPGSHAEAFYTPKNTSVTHVAITQHGPMILDYAVAPHLESLT
jgi:broad specificity phosphatase PhoE